MRKLIWLSMSIVLLAACGAPPASPTTAPQMTLPTAAPAQVSHAPAVDLSAEQQEQAPALHRRGLLPV